MSHTDNVRDAGEIGSVHSLTYCVDNVSFAGNDSNIGDVGNLGHVGCVNMLVISAI